MIINWPDNFARKGHEIFLSGLPIALHCHHYNINLQKTLESTLGDAGARLIYQAAEASSFDSITSFLGHHPKINTVKSKLELAATSYQYCGLGILNFTRIGPEGGIIVSSHSHHVTGWLAKHGRRDTPGCHFARGWIAGALEAIYKRPLGYYVVEETHCKMKRDDVCAFQVKER